MRVLDLMTIDVLTVRPETTLKEAARLMVESRISGLPVVDDRGRLVGIVTEADFLSRQADSAQDARLLAAVFDEAAPSPAATLVKDAMSPDPVGIYPEANLAEAARLMAEHGVKRIPVINDERKVVGIMSRADIVMAFTRPDDVIEDEIRVDLLGRMVGSSGADLDVTVSDGAVTLPGAMNDAADEVLLADLIGRLAGVVDVRFERS